MKVLITGLTTRQTGSTRLLYEYIKCADILVAGFAAAGHQCDVRAIDPSDPHFHEGYDAALVGICPPTSMGARFVFGALETLKRFGSRAALWADDWSITQVKSQINTSVKHFDQRMFGIPSATNKNPLNNRLHVDFAKTKGRAYWLEALQDLQTNVDRRILLWFLPWGEPAAFMRNILPARPVMYDPTSFVIERPWLSCGATPETLPAYPAKVGDPERRWVNATLQKHDPWVEKMRLGWPVVTLGNKRQGQEVLKERDVLGIYGQNWGVLCPEYPKPGMGWWRVRYVHAAVMGNVLLGATRDAGVAGKPYKLLPRDVEGLSDEGLATLAAEQRAELLRQAWPSDRMIDVLDSFVRGLAARG